MAPTPFWRFGGAGGVEFLAMIGKEIMYVVFVIGS